MTKQVFCLVTFLLVVSRTYMVKSELVTTSTTVGGTGGYLFDDYPAWSNGNGNITEIRMSCGESICLVGSISLKYGNGNANIHGAGQWPDETFSSKHDILNVNEHITGVDAWYSSFLNGVQFTTNMRNFNVCGCTDGTYSSQRHAKLLFISGGYGSIVDRLTFHWLPEIDSGSTGLSTNLNNSMTEEEVEKNLTELRKTLTVAKKSTNSYLRTKLSANDDRFSAKVTGSVLGILVLCLVCLSIILSDLSMILKDIKGYTN